MSFEEKHKKGYELLHEQDLDMSLDMARELQKLNPEAAEGYTLEGEIMQKLDQWEMSIKSFDKALAIEPENGRLYNLRGYSYLNMENVKESEADLNRSIDLSDLPTAHRNLVLFKLMNGDGPGAINYLIGRIKADPRDVENWILMGDLMKKGGHDEKARSYYEQALKMDPENEYARKQIED